MAQVPAQGGSAQGKILSPLQIVALWIKAGGNLEFAPVAVARAMAESGGSASVTSANPDGGTNVGVWQLDTEGVGAGHTVSQLQDPLTNAKITVKATQGGTNWLEWSDNWQPWYAQAQQQVAAYETQQHDWTGTGSFADHVLADLGNLGSGITGAVSSIAGQVLGLPSPVTDFLTALEKPVQGLMWFVNPANWARVVAGIFGFVLLGAGLVTLGLAA